MTRKDSVMFNDAFFTIDVEEYFHTHGVMGNPPLDLWDSYPGRVEKNLLKLLDLLDAKNVKATLFFLGYIAKKYPDLVKTAHNKGHEIASHGMFHQLVYGMSPNDFFLDISDSKKTLEDIIGINVIGYRSPCFSATDRSPWIFEQLAKAEFKYDSSVFPARRKDGGLLTGKMSPHWIPTPEGNIYEFPISVIPIFGKNICFCGGGYLRLFPKTFILYSTKSNHLKGFPVMFYIHPREIDPNHPRLETGFKQRFKSYVNLNTVEPKLEAIINYASFRTCSEYYYNHKEDKS